ncbi:hypothetical protein SEVIR_3G023862v4 [Setaria viridis]
MGRGLLRHLLRRRRRRVEGQRAEEVVERGKERRARRPARRPVVAGDLADLVEACTTIIWLGSAYHAAISFGQYDYQGFFPNGPSLTTGPVPNAGAEVTESEFLGSITPVTEALGFMSISSGPLALAGEVYLGQRPDTEQWTSEQSAARALVEFRARLKKVAENIERRNANPELKNRTGTVEGALHAAQADGAARAGAPRHSQRHHHLIGAPRRG